jgi:hypothetical protein
MINELLHVTFCTSEYILSLFNTISRTNKPFKKWHGYEQKIYLVSQKAEIIKWYATQRSAGCGLQCKLPLRNSNKQMRHYHRVSSSGSETSEIQGTYHWQHLLPVLFCFLMLPPQDPLSKQNICSSR